ncbi:Undecaprenyl phosphate-aminoarabinose flippase subunit ArnE [Serratia entomophila]|jgi:undecaprenyl phosphate-alpha-L-ara4N flippase subunit ArnE|uniref:Probable 4-amino-4-deoxy-L-arabinose-phosphoundecaprenol flippase subunit ArnE n=1 Tax=Serratia entomophila TaxID=42906 RepID=A0ABY5CY73_9GAMM|nr:4-amino-4-deoxy-L-arabinose-phosphoundecaprenol flippase subunit ArnE [Serratia entomophila]UIW20412.1 4-amino-4-deoxy-L-arabinose-phosphoundecaprenol flippase subunit ArnE [Serratia entomophila]USV02914.1 4-amino-4-deoxy-L-arabinose-phosphoundecaprenol flippase subunit ArnE [Serratia entomophila]CAI0739719.1 Undecaprenyl phosphate-aminoarabinose flippase subunit ArnE [Serratia entomophila]CAI0784530.1 Undecaprenyl phosphate-aminoarabinose flippase subunit ArnE [Serratia entomophila]CAI0824
MIAFLLVVVVSLLTCGGQLCQKQAAQRWQQPDAQRLKSTLRWLTLAVLLLALGMAVWLNVLQRLPLSLAYPMLSFNFVLVTLAARWLFHEPTTARHWCGVASIMLGILLMSVHA